MCGLLPKDADRIIVLMNPTAGMRSRDTVVGRLAKALRDRDFGVEVMSDPNRMADEAARAHERGRLRTVVSAGGDGTAELVANRTAPGVPITVLPLGTENLLAKHFKLSAHPDSICQAICEGRTVCLDAGRNSDRLFLLMLSCGFDAEVVRRLHDQRTGHIRHLSYAMPILQSILRYEYPELRVYCQRKDARGQLVQREIASHWAFVFNLPTYAVGLGIVPDADGADGMLDVCTFPGGSFWHGLFHLSSVVLGQHREWSGCETIRATSVRIDSEGKVPCQTDGEPAGFLPVEIDVLPGRVTLVVPPDWGKR